MVSIGTSPFWLTPYEIDSLLFCLEDKGMWWNGGVWIETGISYCTMVSNRHSTYKDIYWAPLDIQRQSAVSKGNKLKKREEERSRDKREKNKNKNTVNRYRQISQFTELGFV